MARLSGRHRELFYRWLFRFSLTVFLVTTLLPLYYTFVLAITPHRQVGSFVPPTVSLEGFSIAWRLVDWGLAMTNSMIITLGTVALVLAVAIPAAYAFGRLSFPGRRVLFVGVLSLILFPPQGIAMQLYTLFTFDIELLGTSYQVFNTPPAIILPVSTFNLPIAVGLLTVFFASVPDDLEKTALVEGANRIQAIRHAVLPLAKPGIVSVAVLVYIDAYTEMFFSKFMSAGYKSVGSTVQMGIYGIYHPPRGLVWPNALAAAGVMGLIPSALVLLYMVGKLDTWLTEWGAITR